LAPDTPLFNTAAVARRTGVPAPTFRAWERRYGFPRPRREPNGRRLYSEQDVEAIRWLQEQGASGMAMHRAVALLRHRQEPTPRVLPAAEPGAFGALQRALLDAFLALDADRAEAIMAEGFALFPVEDVCARLLAPALVEVGERWHAGELTVAEEHFATALVRSRLATLLAAFMPRQGPLAMAACAPGEGHEIGLLMVSLFLARAGCRVRYLGPDVPIEDLGRTVVRVRPQLVILSAQGPGTVPALAEALAWLNDLPAPRPVLAFGGQAFVGHPERAAGIPGTYLGDDAAQAVAMVQRLLNP
jgi:methanogenic corrinoid protein MtbC1